MLLCIIIKVIWLKISDAGEINSIIFYNVIMNLKVFRLLKHEKAFFCYTNYVCFIHDNPSYENIQSSCQETHASIKLESK